MIDMHRWLGSDNGLDITMIMQVHDELVFEVAAADAEAAKTPITEHMCGAVSLRVPLLVDIGVGANWDEAH
jgi:DNA polymerase-1